MSVLVSVLVLLSAGLQQPSATIVCTVVAGGNPVAGADVVIAGQTYFTDVKGEVRIQVQPGSVAITVAKADFAPVTTSIAVAAEQTQTVVVELQPQPTVEEHVTVSATRTDKRLEDQPMRVEVVDRDDIEEEQMMTPGNIVMMLSEMGGLRVQATSPSLGAASIRIQGMRGRYTRFLSDGLPLFGADVGGLGLLQIPPTDLGQVEVIKGVASALYGAGALGGVVDLISRRPGPEPSREALVNRTSLGGTDTVLFAAQPLTERWSGTLLVGGHWQERNDINGDGWADLPGYSRAVVRPRVFWDDKKGDTIFATGGVTWERRTGGTLPDAVLRATGQPFVEALDTSRFDGGIVARMLLGGRYVLTARGSATRQQRDHLYGDTRERNEDNTLFGEVTVRGTHGSQTWVGGAAFERAALVPRDVPRFAYTYRIPGVFAQDDIDLRRWLSVSASGRIDVHNQFGTFFSPRVSALVRGDRWNSRASVGTGFFAPTPLTEETDAAGLTRLQIPTPLKAERGRSASVDLTRTMGALTVTATWFHSKVDDPLFLNRATYVLENLPEPTTNTGIELLAALRKGQFSITPTYIYVRSREGLGADRSDVPLTPRHNVSLVGVWQKEQWGRVGLEFYYSGRQRLEDNPFRTSSHPYALFGALVERRVHGLRLFVNAENLGNFRQTQRDPLIRPARAIDGRWTVDAWAPLDGRVVNGGVRAQF